MEVRSVWCMPIREREEEKKSVSTCVCMEERSHDIGQEILAAGSTYFLSVPSISLDAKARTHTKDMIRIRHKPSWINKKTKKQKGGYSSGIQWGKLKW